MIIDGDGGSGPETCGDAYPPDTEGMGNDGGETGPDRGKCEEGCGGEEEYECVSGAACARVCADALKCGCVLWRTGGGCDGWV